MTTLKVLVIEDDRDLAESPEILLQTADMQIVPAVSSEEGLGKFRSDDFDAAPVNTRLPGNSGFDCRHDIRRIEPDAEVTMTTGYGQPDAGDRALQASALCLLHKPLVADDLLVMLRTG